MPARKSHALAAGAGLRAIAPKRRPRAVACKSHARSADAGGRPIAPKRRPRAVKAPVAKGTVAADKPVVRKRGRAASVSARRPRTAPRCQLEASAQPTATAHSEESPTTSTKTPVRVGSDFSGLNTAFFATKEVCDSVGHLRAVASHACDKLKAAMRFSKHHVAPERFDKDILTRDTATLPPSDVFAFTAPCTSYSPLGTRDGVSDKQGDGLLIFESLKFIDIHKPRIVIAENSPLLMTKFADVAQVLERTLTASGYTVHSAILNTSDFGIPQRRKRWYLLAIRNDVCRTKLAGITWFPKPLPYCIQLKDMIRPLDTQSWKPHPPALAANGLWNTNVLNAYRDCVAKGINPFITTVIVDMHATEHFSYHSVGIAPTLTRHRCGSFGYWCSTKGGPLDINDFMMLQGFPATLDHRGAGLTDGQMGGCLGNAQSINVLMRVVAHGMYLAKMITKTELEAVTR